jgi:murein DD-endopeptidase MepM/ murein hydrolase activator NlpD
MEDLITDGSILNGYGYDMQEWNTVHCDIADDEDDSHQAIDILCSSGTKIYAGMSGKIEKIDNDKGLIVIRKDSYNYWYDGDGEGKKRDTEIYYYNVGAKSDLKEGDKVKKGDYIGLSFPEHKCEKMSNDSVSDYYVHIKVYIDTDGYGWEFIDPRLVFE